MGSKGNRRGGLVCCRKLLDCGLDPVDVGGDESGVIVKDTDFVDLGSSWAHLTPCLLDVLTILPTARIRTVCRSYKRQSPLNTVRFHLSQRIGKERVPVSISPVNRQIDFGLGELRSQHLDEFFHLCIDRADTIKVLIMFGNFQQPLTGNRFTTQDVFQKRNHVIGFFGPTERNDQQGIIRAIFQFRHNNFLQNGRARYGKRPHVKHY